MQRLKPSEYFIISKLIIANVNKEELGKMKDLLVEY